MTVRMFLERGGNSGAKSVQNTSRTAAATVIASSARHAQIFEEIVHLKVLRGSGEGMIRHACEKWG